MGYHIPVNISKGFLEPQNVESIISTIKSSRDLLLFITPWRTGMKTTEIISLRKQDINYQNGALLIAKKNQRGKNGIYVISRLIPIDAKTLDMFQKYIENRKQFSYKGDLLFPISRQRVNQVFRNITKKVLRNRTHNLGFLRVNILTPELLRRSFAIHCIKNGMDSNKLAYILGYKSNGEGYVRIDGKYLAEVLKACGGMVDFSLTNALSPMLFTLDGYRVVVMPMVTDKATKEAKAKAEAKATVPSEPTEPVAEQAEPEPVTEPEAVTKAKAKPKHSRKREKVAVA